MASWVVMRAAWSANAGGVTEDMKQVDEIIGPDFSAVVSILKREEGILTTSEAR